MARPQKFDRGDVLQQAMLVFWRQGYEATSVDDLVAATGINRASMYNSFGDKHALYVETLKRYQEQSGCTLLRLLQREGSVRDALEQLFNAVIEDATCDTEGRGCFMVNATIERAPHDPAIAAIIEANRVGTEAAFAESLQRGQARGEISPRHDPQALAKYLFAAVQGLRVQAKVHLDRASLEQVVRLTLSVLD